jgi:hypothetical protein
MKMMTVGSKKTIANNIDTTLHKPIFFVIIAAAKYF